MNKPKRIARNKADKTLQSLINQIQEEAEEERFRIARELHDDVGQQITLLSFLLHRMNRSLGEKATDEIKQAEEITARLIGKVRDISLQLRPAMLDNAGLLATLQGYLQDLSSRTGINFELKHSGLGKDLPRHIATTVYRIIEEASTNIARHAKAERFEVVVRAGKKSLSLSIRDDGAGFNPAEVPAASTGLRTMRERTRYLGGTFELESAPGEGTRLTVKLPLISKLKNQNHNSKIKTTQQ
ncbi:MAG: sensor histidine kinase [Chloroflexi bacterium]|nr:sensor histidine kinase [Chloroflexota bacterium]